MDISVQKRSPKSTGFEIDLYALDNVSHAKRQFLEDVFLKRVDQFASDALNGLCVENGTQLSDEQRSGWSRFLISLHHRTPESLAALKQRAAIGLIDHLKFIERNYERLRREGDPATFEEARFLFDNKWSDQFLATLFAKVVDSDNVMKWMSNMKWSVLTIANYEYSFLTSDRPFVRTNSIQHPNDYIMVPVTPNKLFLAANTDQMIAQIRAKVPQHLVGFVNDRVCRQAFRFVYSESCRQQRFIDNRLARGRVLPAAPNY